VLCTVALARRFAPLQSRRGLAALAGALGIDVEEVHRALPDAETCARVFCALFGRLCASAPTIRDALALLRPRRRRRKELAKSRPDLSSLPKDPGVYVFRDAEGRPLYVGKSVCLRTRARAHFAQPSTWTGEAEVVDYQTTESELGALLLEHRLIQALKPRGNVRGKADPDGYVYLRCRLDISFPILEVARAPAAGHAICVGPVQGRAAVAELVEQLNSLFGLRHCGRALPRRTHPSAYGQMGRCLSPCLRDLDPNLYRERLDAALALFAGGGDGGEALLAHVDGQIRAAAAEQRYERAAWLQRRRGRLAALVSQLRGVLRAIHAGTRLVVAAHPAAAGRFDAFWIVGGRVVDWGPLPRDPARLAARSAALLAGSPRPWLLPEEVGEARLVGAWIAAHAPPALELRAGAGVAEHAAFAAELDDRFPIPASPDDADGRHQAHG
jgi:DNA polymerase-3 subunit epsilon